MMFLLAKHTEMLPGPSGPTVIMNAFEWVYDYRTEGIPNFSRAELAQKLQALAMEHESRMHPGDIGARLAATLIAKGWDTLHARKLSSGGELVTVVWVLTRHIGHSERNRDEEPWR
jgi:hypothetical protein